MTNKTKVRGTPRPEQALRAAFSVIEAQPTPDTLKDHIDRLTGEPPKPRKRN